MMIVAEGAETADEVAILGQFRCDLVQGYIFARPAAANDALKSVRALEGKAIRVEGSQTTQASAKPHAAAIVGGAKRLIQPNAKALRESADL